MTKEWKDTLLPKLFDVILTSKFTKIFFVACSKNS